MKPKIFGLAVGLLSASLVACAPVPLTSVLRPCPEDEIDQLLSTLPAGSWSPRDKDMALPGVTFPDRMNEKEAQQ